MYVRFWGQTSVIIGAPCSGLIRNGALSVRPFVCPVRVFTSGIEAHGKSSLEKIFPFAYISDIHIFGQKSQSQGNTDPLNFWIGDTLIPTWSQQRKCWQWVFHSVTVGFSKRRSMAAVTFGFFQSVWRSVVIATLFLFSNGFTSLLTHWLTLNAKLNSS